MQTILNLYSTLGCHLCEQAEALLKAQAIPYQLIDISEDDALFARFEISIPVLEDPASTQKNLLYWPFDSETLNKWYTQT